jgi:hypothetical protein
MPRLGRSSPSPPRAMSGFHASGGGTITFVNSDGSTTSGNDLLRIADQVADRMRDACTPMEVLLNPCACGHPECKRKQPIIGLPPGTNALGVDVTSLAQANATWEVLSSYSNPMNKPEEFLALLQRLKPTGATLGRQGGLPLGVLHLVLWLPAGGRSISELVQVPV